MEENARRLVCNGNAAKSSMDVMVMFEKLRIKDEVWQNIQEEEND